MYENLSSKFREFFKRRSPSTILRRPRDSIGLQARRARLLRKLTPAAVSRAVHAASTTWRAPPGISR